MTTTEIAFVQWDQCKATLRESIPEPFYNTFIEPMTALHTEQSVLSLVVPEARMKDHIEMRYGSLLKEAVLRHFPGQISLIRFQNPDETRHTARKLSPDETEKQTNQKTLQWDGRFLPHTALREELEALLQLRSFYRPIYITGGAGSGKTALARKWVEHFDGRASHLSLSEYLGSFVASIRNHTTHEWKKTLRENSLLIIDDLQLLKSTAARCQEELRNLIDDFERESKLLVFLADRDPGSLTLSRDLKSRLMPSRQLHLIYPDRETRQQIVREVLQEDGLTLKEEMIEHLATQIPTDMRLLRAAVHRLSFQSIEPLRMTVPEIDRICDGLYRNDPGIRPEAILSVVSDFFRVSAEQIRGPAKDKKASMARHTVSYLCSQMLGMTLSEIARITNRKDHTGVLYAINRLEKLLQQDLFLNRQLEEIKERVLSESRR